jgi:para-aminobenzoate synthetase component 1
MNEPQIHLLDLHGMEPLEVFLSVPQDAKHLSALFSDGSADSRWSFLAWDPVKVFSFSKTGEKEEFLHYLKERKTNLKSDIPFIDGAIGAVDYEYGYELLGIPYPVGTGRDLSLRVRPKVEFSFYDRAFAYDHHEKKWWGINTPTVPAPGRDAINRVSTGTVGGYLDLQPSWDFQEYKKRFDFIHENIRKGEIYQACLTFPFLGKPVENPRILFYELLKKRPAPMAAYLEQSHRTVMSLSPERFISWDGVNLETKPIKGTRKRGNNPAEDQRLKEELLSDEKEKAELCMITDLLRNDMAKVSKTGTVKVLEHQTIQECPNVWHTYSHIRSQTKEGIEAWDILESMFPGGSISGCPKKKAVELLSEAEDSPRGIYTGCIGYISDHGTMDMNIAIRTLEQHEDKLQASFGGGVVYDSKAEAEFEECFTKSRVLHI